LFSFLCVIEGIRRAFLARKKSTEMAALAKVESKLAKLLRTTQKLSRPRLQHSLHYYNDEEEESSQTDPLEYTLQYILRTWVPVVMTLVLWSFLIPWEWLWTGGLRDVTNHSIHDDVHCLPDPSLANVMIANGSRQLIVALAELHQSAVAIAWKIALPFAWWQPLALWHRLRVLARIARYARYAGPLLRLLLKLNDQIWVFTKTWRQTCTAQLHKAQRLARKSQIWADLAHIESLAKVQNTLVSLPSQLLVHKGISQSLLTAQKRQASNFQQRLAWLKAKLLHSSTSHVNLMEIYDRLMDLTHEVSTEFKSAFWNANLISPQTRFSVAWRVVVTCTLLSELFRLYWSWELSRSFDMRYLDLTRQLLGLCQSKSRPVRKWIGRLLKLPINHPWLDTCRQSSPSSQFSLLFADWSEIGIALVSFLDIFVWFFTGELDETGITVPKPWFQRCVLPGTLTQVLDHPTVPAVLPQLIATTWTLAGSDSIGYGRLIRWGLAVSPALEYFLVSPIYNYLFRPMTPDEYMAYSESLGVMRTFSSTNADMLWPRAPSYQHISPKTAAALDSFPSRNDLLDSSLRSTTEDYGLFY
jgi:hypothetical protein